MIKPRRASHVAALFAALWSCVAGAQQLGEAEIKAAFIYNFVQFTTWPGGLIPDGAPLPVCARGNGAVAAALSAIAGRKVPGRAIVLRPLPDDGPRSCAVVVVDQYDAGWLRRAAAQMPGSATLVIADDNDATMQGAMITLALAGRKVVFDVNVTLVKSAGLGISSRVMQLARAVR